MFIAYVGLFAHHGSSCPARCCVVQSTLHDCSICSYVLRIDNTTTLICTHWWVPIKLEHPYIKISMIGSLHMYYNPYMSDVRYAERVESTRYRENFLRWYSISSFDIVGSGGGGGRLACVMIAGAVCNISFVVGCSASFFGTVWMNAIIKMSYLGK